MVRTIMGWLGGIAPSINRKNVNFRRKLYAFRWRNILLGVKYRTTAILRSWRFLWLQPILAFAAYVPALIITVPPVSDAVAFFTSIGAMIGGIIAILFTLSALIVSNATARLPSDLYRRSVNEASFKVIFVLLGFFSFANFFFALTFVSSGNVYRYGELYLALLSVAETLYLVYVFYEGMVARLHPLGPVKEAHRTAGKNINITEKYARQMAEILTTNPQAQERQSPSLALAYAYGQLQPRFGDVATMLGGLFDYHDRLVASKERSTALIVLDYAVDIIKQYLAARKDSSIILPTEYLLTVTSDSQRFLATPVERLLEIGRGYIRSEDDPGVAKVIAVFVDMAQAATNIKYSTDAPQSSPIFEQFTGYLTIYVKEIEAAGRLEGLFRAAQVYRTLARIAIDFNLSQEVYAYIKALEGLAYAAIKQHHDVALSEVISASQSVALYMIQKRYFNFRMELEHMLEAHGRVAAAWLSSVRGTRDENFMATTSIPAPYTRLSEELANLPRIISAEPDGKVKSELRRIYLDGLEQFYGPLRRLADTGAFTNNMLTKPLADAIATLGRSAVNAAAATGWERESSELLKHAKGYLNLPSFFVPREGKFGTEPSFDDLSDAIAKISLDALSSSEPVVAEPAPGILWWIAKAIMTRGNVRTLYDVLDPLERMVYVGILAKKLGHEAVVVKVLENIRLFETEWRRRYFADVPPGTNIMPSPDEPHGRAEQLLRQKREMPDDRFGGFLDEASIILRSRVEASDIEAFIQVAWPPQQPAAETGPADPIDLGARV